MKLIDVVKILEAEVICGEQFLEREIGTACGADLMSDVLAFHKENALLLTGLVNMQVVRTAEMSDIVCVVFVRGKKPNADIIELANENLLPIMTTKYPLFESCGLLFSNGIKGSPVAEE